MLTWVEIDAAALSGNIAEFRRRLGPGPKLGAVVKSNAYGHGMREVARLAVAAGADWLCVNNVEEGVALRDAGLSVPVVLLGYVPLEAIGEVVARGLDLVVYNRETVSALDRAARASGKTAGVHLKVETGTNRQGVLERDVPAFLEAIRAAPGVALRGVSSHFAKSQIAAFTRITETVARMHGAPLLRHVACSAAVLLFNRTHLDLARVGISMYGLWPSKETYVSGLERGKPSLDLKPVLRWKTRIAQVKDVPEGGFVGYGGTWRATRPTRIAVLPVGYYEGYDRGLSNIAHALVRGRRAPIRGRICMNMCMVDVTDVPGAALEDEVVLLGRQGDEAVTAEQLAAWCGTISYEIVSRIHPALPRVISSP
jgi:alanine racemase